VDLDKDRLPVAPLPALWRFHAGDDPAWADPKFDDSGWSLLKSDQGWNRQGYKGSGDTGWYRFSVRVPASIEQVSFMLPIIWTSYEVFADGEKIGSWGKMPPHPIVYDMGPSYFVYKVPASKMAVTQTVRIITVAIRVWQSPQADEMDSGGTIGGGGVVGDANQIQSLSDSYIAEIFSYEASRKFLVILSGLIALAAFSLFFVNTKNLEYFWFGLKMTALATDIAVKLSFSAFPDKIVFLALGILDIINALLYVAFFLQLFRPNRKRLYKLALASALLAVPSYCIISAFPLLRGSKLGLSIDCLLLPSTFWIFTVLFTFARRPSKTDSRWIDARLLFFPFLLQTGMALVLRINDVASSFTHWYPSIADWNISYAFDRPILETPLSISCSDLIQLFTMLGFLAVLILRFARTSSEQERHITEIKGARSVQQFLIPDDQPQVPGLTIESDYRPAREVGGDFFQIIPDTSDGSALVLVGDVAGKGMQAGMLATLLVGSMRTAATFTRDPAVILSTLNNRLCGKGNATCLALRIEADGGATLVNAGHLPPYCNGVELPMEGALPLGTIAGIEFPILHFQISPGDTLTLISDGILEAQKPDGELFGFERIAEHLRHSTTASSLASAAQEFGQEDDITVLTIIRRTLPIQLVLERPELQM
jgi:phosphoserine phosphatase RsbU/P